MKHHSLFVAAVWVAIGWNSFALAQGEQDGGFISLFNGQDLSGWKIPEGDNGHWRVVDGVIDYDAASESPGKDKHLWTKDSYGDFILKADWRLKSLEEVEQALYDVPIVLLDGSYLQDINGNNITIKRPSPDSGLLLRGTGQAQVNLWGWPIGSGEVYGYRHRQTDPVIRAAVTPRINADKPLGEWNRLEIYMIQDRLTVLLNSQTVLANAQLPAVPPAGPIALQHHGGRNVDGSYKPGSSLVQFRNLWIKPLSLPMTTP